jgi:hypothetical protein
MSPGVEPLTSRWAVDWWGWANRPPPWWTLLYKQGNCYLSLLHVMTGGKKGSGLSPNPRRNTPPHDRTMELLPYILYAGSCNRIGLWPYWSATKPGAGARKGVRLVVKPAIPCDRPQDLGLEPMEKGQRMSARPHGPTYMTRGAPMGGCTHNLFAKWVFTQCFGFLVVTMPIFG